jgi:hypothetical protein
MFFDYNIVTKILERKQMFLKRSRPGKMDREKQLQETRKEKSVVIRSKKITWIVRWKLS